MHFGRFRVVALLSTILKLLIKQKPFEIRVAVNDTQEIRRASMVFVGNNTLQLTQLDLDMARCTAQDQLAVVVVKPINRIAMASVLMRGMLKALNENSRLKMFCTDRFEVDTKRRKINGVIDGEVACCQAAAYSGYAWHPENNLPTARGGRKYMTPKSR